MLLMRWHVRLKTRKKIERRREKKKTMIFTLLRVCGDVIAREARVIPFHKKTSRKFYPILFLLERTTLSRVFGATHRGVIPVFVPQLFLFVKLGVVPRRGKGGRDAIKTLLLLFLPHPGLGQEGEVLVRSHHLPDGVRRRRVRAETGAWIFVLRSTHNSLANNNTGKKYMFVQRRLIPGWHEKNAMQTKKYWFRARAISQIGG